MIRVEFHGGPRDGQVRLIDAAIFPDIYYRGDERPVREGPRLTDGQAHHYRITKGLALFRGNVHAKYQGMVDIIKPGRPARPALEVI
jgi:hypothetical protein